MGLNCSECKTAGTTQIYPAASGLTASGQAVQISGRRRIPTSIHVHLDFSALGLATVRQLWLTFAPALNYASGWRTHRWCHMQRPSGPLCSRTGRSSIRVALHH